MDDDPFRVGRVFGSATAPGLECLRECARKTQDVERRVVDEFFWFWPDGWDEESGGDLQSLLNAGDKEALLQKWTEQESNESSETQVVARHNLAVAYHLMALDLEDALAGSPLAFADLLCTGRNWQMSLGRWKRLQAEESFWVLFEERLCRLNDAALSVRYGKEFRREFPHALAKISAMLAVKRAQEGRLHWAAIHVNYAGSVTENMRSVVSLVVKPIEDRIRMAVGHARDELEKEPAQAGRVAFQLLRSTQEARDVLCAMLPDGDYSRADLFDEVADACVRSHVTHRKRGGELVTSRKILAQAALIASSSESRSVVFEYLRQVSGDDSYERLYVPFVKELGYLGPSRADPRQRLEVFESRILGHLAQVGNSAGEKSEVYKTCCDAVAERLALLSVEAYNGYADERTALCAIQRAASIACDGELSSRYARDATVLEASYLQHHFGEELFAVASADGDPASNCEKLRRRIANELRRCKDRSGREFILQRGATAFERVAVRACNVCEDFASATAAIEEAISLEQRMNGVSRELSTELQQVRAMIRTRQLKAQSFSKPVVFHADPIPYVPPPLPQGGEKRKISSYSPQKHVHEGSGRKEWMGKLGARCGQVIASAKSIVREVMS